ncbi:MAG: hypothetical protein KDN22_16275 [Verrucomicrobiae bacterium]|nr:hypothetical protein [Verrucomicrobiae bacterium]
MTRARSHIPHASPLSTREAKSGKAQKVAKTAVPIARRARRKQCPAFSPREEFSHDESELAAWGATSVAKNPLDTRLAIGSAIVIAALIGALLSFSRPDHTTDAGIPPRKELPELTTSLDMRTSIELFLAAESVEERLTLVRHPEETAPRMKEFYEVRGHDPQTILQLGSRLHRDTAFGLNLVWVDVELDDGRWRTATFEETTGGLKLDWEQWVLFQPMPWEEFVEKGSNEAKVFRVNVERSDYYNFDYAEEDRFDCFKLTDPLRSQSCWAYSSKGSEASALIERLFEREGRTFPEHDEQNTGTDRDGALESKDMLTAPEGEPLEVKVMLRLRLAEGAVERARSQAAIDEVVSDSWFVPLLPE